MVFTSGQGRVSVLLVGRFVGTPLDSDLPPGHVERCRAAASSRPPESPPARHRVENAAQQSKSHDLSVHTPGATDGTFYAAAKETTLR